MHVSDYTITFDGGSKNNGNPDAEGYGSYQIKTRTGRQVIERLEFPAGTTNNEAEYHALIGALVDLTERIHARGRTASEFTLHIAGDSQLVLNQVQGNWRVKKQHLRPLCDYARNLVELFQEVKFEWKAREHNVEVLGH